MWINFLEKKRLADVKVAWHSMTELKRPSSAIKSDEILRRFSHGSAIKSSSSSFLSFPQHSAMFLWSTGLEQQPSMVNRLPKIFLLSESSFKLIVQAPFWVFAGSSKKWQNFSLYFFSSEAVVSSGCLTEKSHQITFKRRVFQTPSKYFPTVFSVLVALPSDLYQLESKRQGQAIAWSASSPENRP